MLLNRLTNKVITVFYHPWTGGHSVINSLGLSDHCYLQCEQLVSQQWFGRLTKKQKLQILVDKANDVKDKWIDLSLGDIQLLTWEQHDPSYFMPIIRRISNESKYFCLSAHNNLDLDLRLKVWPKTRVVTLVNGKDFMEWRWNGYDKHSLPFCDYAPTYKDDELDLPLMRKIDSIAMLDNIYFDAQSLFDVKDFCSEVERLYSYFKLPDFDEAVIAEYYHAHYNALDRLRAKIDGNFR